MSTTLKKRGSRRRVLFLMILAALALSWISLGSPPNASADMLIHLTIDGREISEPPAPMMQNNRTLVPVRVVSEDLGAIVTWNNDDRSVTIVKGNRTILMRIDRNLIEYTIDGVKYYNLSDVPPRIYGDKTFVPIRLISNALGVGIDWEQDTKTVAIDSSKEASITPFFDMKISSIKSETITGTTTLQSTLPSPLPYGASQIKYLLISPETGTGFVIARGTNLYSAYEWLPSSRDNGQKILVSALYDSSGNFLAGDAMPLQVGIVPEVALLGVYQNQTIDASITLSAKPNFSAAYVKYEITKTTSGKTYTTTEQDPLGTYSWTPSMEYNGPVTINVIAYDQKDQPYPGQMVSINVEMQRKFTVSGIKTGQIIDRQVTISASRNFDVLETEYWLRDTGSGAEGLLSRVAYASYPWFPGPGLSGSKEVFIKVKATDGTVYTSEPIPVIIQGVPKLLLQGAGPNQVITSQTAVKLKVTSNVPLNDVKYIMTNTVTGAQKIFADVTGAAMEFSYTPVQGDDGSWKIKAVGTDTAGQPLSTDEVTVTVYTGKTYSSLPVIEKSAYLGLASKLAVDDWKQSGMSAALQTAQAILETGWGQSVPVDKYNGQMSYNLFGIKGSGIAGSVLSNTWEEYNGVSFRTDAKFRAYHNVNESWADHNKLLLTGSRYEPFRKVMYDSSLGAWALRRAGYATDSKYPVKLMDIIDLYQLEELDRVAI